jgi:hypothetical protein
MYAHYTLLSQAARRKKKLQILTPFPLEGQKWKNKLFRELGNILSLPSQQNTLHVLPGGILSDTQTLGPLVTVREVPF